MFVQGAKYQKPVSFTIDLYIISHYPYATYPLPLYFDKTYRYP